MCQDDKIVSPYLLRPLRSIAEAARTKGMGPELRKMTKAPAYRSGIDEEGDDDA